MPRKRSLADMEASGPPPEKEEMSLLQKIRNMWEFASVMQYIFMFGKAVKIDEDFDIEDFETECLKPGYSEKLEDIGLTLLKWISSHRGLNFDIWDEYTRRQYQAKAPHLNPYGEEEQPRRFRDFDIFQKIRVLHQLTVWTFWNPDRLRERMADHPHEAQQLEWRVEEFGYGMDGQQECQYYLLDDNRLYRRTEPPLPPPPKAKPKATSQKAQAARRRERASKRRKVEDSQTPEVEEEDVPEPQSTETNGAAQGTPSGADVDTLGGFKWKCIAISLTDYKTLCDKLKKSKDPNEKNLRQRLVDEVIPTIEAAEERQRRKIERRERELIAMEKMTHAKRSSRIADKHERDKREHEAAEADRRRAADLAAAHREKERQEHVEQDRQSRMMTREQRIKDREYKRLLAEEELVRAAEEEKRIAEGYARGSERQLKERIAKNKKELEDLNADEEWTFDCSGCNVHGKNLDDGSHSVACEKCSVWQHSKCLGISKAAAEKDDFHFVCADCKAKEERANQPKISLKFKVTPSPSPASPVWVGPSPQKTNVRVEVPAKNGPRPNSQGTMTNGYGYPPAASPPYASRHPQQYPPLQPNSNPPYGYPKGPSLPQYPFTGISQPHNRPQSSSSSPPPPPNNQYPYMQSYPPRPGQQGQPWAPIQYQPQGSYHQQAQYPPPSQPRPSSSEGMPRPPSSHNQPNGHPTPAARLPSPVLNRPIMSPSQGNYDVGPVAGIPQKTAFGTRPSPSPSPAHLANGTTPALYRPQPGQIQTPTPPQQPVPSSSSSSSSSTQQQPFPLSGVSPTKPQQQSYTPLPPPSNVPIKMSISHSPPRAVAGAYIPGTGPAPVPVARSVSGTPIIPPTEKLQPSPEQLSSMGVGGAVPTPSKLEVMGRAAVEMETAEGGKAKMEAHNGVGEGTEA